MDDYFQTVETERAIKQIRAFCETPALNGGGMMLVTGQRGVGKTRLVDEALNDRRELVPLRALLYARVVKLKARQASMLWKLTTGLGVLAQWFKPRIGRLLAIASGHDPYRCRLRINRRPRGVTRLLLPVPVDPFFPDGGAAVAPGSAEHADLDGDTLALLRNLVFALTSAIDPRSGVRRHGRTLKARLGTPTYWFTRTALIKPQRQPKSAWTIALCLLLAFLAGVVLHLWLRDPTFAPWTDPGYVWAVCWRSAWLTIPATLLAWLWLRYLDLARLRRMSAHLYDLIHAQQFSVEAQASIERTWRWEAKGQRLLQVLAALAVGWGLIVSPPIWEWIVAQSPGVFGVAGVNGEKLSQGSDPSTAGRILVKPTAPPPTEPPISPVGGAVIALAGLAVLGFTGSRSTRRHASFGPGNRVWLISLLRRYLYLLHRAGVEPVLVIDEIDKLGVNADTVWAQTAADPRPADPNGANQRSGPGQLDRFIATLVRLKQSLGAEVIWILIDSNALYARVIADRNRPDEQGPLATLIQCEVGLNPIPFREYKTYYKKAYRQDQARTKGTTAANQRLPEDHQLAGWWLEARGVFFGLSARREPSPLGAPDGGPADTLALFLADILDHLRKDAWFAFTHCIGAQPRDWQELAEQIARSPWHRRYLEIGLMELAARLVDPTRVKPLYKEFNSDTKAPDLDAGSPQSLKRKGERGLFNFLQNVYDDGDPALGIGKGYGIPTRPSGGDEAEVRVVPPEQWPPPDRSVGAPGHVGTRTEEEQSASTTP